MIRLENLTKHYGAVHALDGLSLEVPAGCIFAFLGPNGAGKTTTIRILTGLTAPSSGGAFIDGHDTIHDHLALKRVVGYVPDHPYIYERLTGREFLWFVGGLYGIPEPERDAACQAMLEQFGLGDGADRLVETYSHGMRQRLAFCSALLIDPPVLICDEPWLGLDPHNVRLVKDLLGAKTARGHTIFLSTHSLAIAEEIADVIGILDAGRLLHMGTVTETLALRQAGTLEELFLAVTGPAALAE